MTCASCVRQEVVRAGWLGQDAAGAEPSLLGSVVDAQPALGVLSGWLVLASLAAGYVSCWQPRHERQGGNDASAHRP
jgi:hypothetical protein